MSKIEEETVEKKEHNPPHNGFIISRRFLKVSSYLQLSAIVTLIVTLAVTMNNSVSFELLSGQFGIHNFSKKVKLMQYEKEMEPPSRIGFSRKILAFGRTTEHDFARALLIDAEGNFEAVELRNLKLPREVLIQPFENIIMYHGQLIVYQTMPGISKSRASSIISNLKGKSFFFLRS